MKALLAVGILAFGSLANGSVLGILDLSGVAKFTSNTLTASGDFTTSHSTTLTYGAGILVGAGTQGVLESFPPTNEPNFLTFLTIPSLVFDLSSINPGSANTNCSGLSIGGSCSPTSGSPFILTDIVSGTIVTVTGDGTAIDGTVPISDWLGALTVNIAGDASADSGDPGPRRLRHLFLCG